MEVQRPILDHVKKFFGCFFGAYEKVNIEVLNFEINLAKRLLLRVELLDASTIKWTSLDPYQGLSQSDSKLYVKFWF